MNLTEKKQISYSIPDKMNFTISLLSVIGIHLLLIAGGRMDEYDYKFFSICLLFGIIFIPAYSLIHEAAHHVGFSNGKMNYLLGIVLSVLFMASFTFIQKAHMNHHKNNRTDAELTDLYYDYRKKWRKRLSFFSIHIGLKWIGIVVATLLFCLFPKGILSRLIGKDNEVSILIRGTHASDVMFNKIRLESFLTLFYHAFLILIFEINIVSYLIMYIVHGFVWSSQNYVSHAFSPRSIIRGAHNHKMNPFIQLFYLNFNLHLAHHENPSIPWIHLPKFIRGSHKISYLKAYIRLWKGPKLITENDPLAFRQMVK